MSAGPDATTASSDEARVSRLPPAGHILLDSVTPPAVRTPLEHRNQLPQGGFRVAHQVHFGGVAHPDERAVDIDLHPAGLIEIRQELAVEEIGSHDEQGVAIPHQFVAGPGAEQSDGAGDERRLVRLFLQVGGQNHHCRRTPGHCGPQSAIQRVRQLVRDIDLDEIVPQRTVAGRGACADGRPADSARELIPLRPGSYPGRDQAECGRLVSARTASASGIIRSDCSASRPISMY